MENLEGFILSLSDRGINSVAIDNGGKILIVNLGDLKEEINKNGISEIADTYYEDMSFISNNGDLIEIHAIY